MSLQEVYEKGKRVKFLGSNSDEEGLYLESGDEGTVDFIDDVGTIFVKWDKGGNLGLIPGVDRFTLI